MCLSKDLKLKKMCLSKEQPVATNTGKAQTMQSHTMAANNVTYCFLKTIENDTTFCTQLLLVSLGPWAMILN